MRRDKRDSLQYRCHVPRLIIGWMKNFREQLRRKKDYGIETKYLTANQYYGLPCYCSRLYYHFRY